jgi:hypothetical protein
MLMTLLFVLVYLLPVLPVARRLHYVRTLPVPVGKPRTLPHRVITKSPFPTSDSKYTYINENIIERAKVCQNCGSDEDYHEGGPWWTLGQGDQKRYAACNNFKRWDGKKKDWPRRTIPAPLQPQEASVSTSILMSLGFWWYLVASEVGKKTYFAIEPDWTKFAVEYHGAETKDQKIKRLEASNAAYEAETERRLALAESAKTLEELP